VLRASPRLAVVLAAAALALAACGGGDDGGASPSASTAPAARPATPATIALDFTPNAVHAPIYAAVREGLDRRHGVRLRIREPGSSPNSLALLTSGRVDVGILDIQDLALARQRGVDVVGVAALVQKPLAALIAQPGIHRPRDLAGRTVGVSGLPSDPAFVRAVVQGDGGDYARVKQVTIGFQAVSSILSRRVDAVPAFWNAEGVALRERGVRTNEFRVEDYGAPPYPEVVLVTARRTLRREPKVVAGVVAAIGDGVGSVLAHPEPAAREIAKAAGQADLGLVRAQLRALRPVVVPPMRLDRGVLERWAAFDARFGIVRTKPDVDRAFDFGVAR
jgi:NitT/TauT family transport system substrate-binding protein/putative hydroxymethylpyrimidine transport system substrate-binding protein